MTLISEETQAAWAPLLKYSDQHPEPSFDHRTGHDGEGYYIRTYTGRKLYWDNVEQHDFDIRDIAHALAMKCRWSGHTNRFYSIAQHSVFVSKFVSRDQRMEGLLHDAAEAYMPDFPSPLKWYLIDSGFQQLKSIEKRVEQCIEAKFMLHPERNIIKQADLLALSTEHRDLMPEGDEALWMGPPASKALKPVGPDAAEKMFLDRYARLVGYR